MFKTAQKIIKGVALATALATPIAAQQSVKVNTESAITQEAVNNRLRLSVPVGPYTLGLTQDTDLSRKKRDVGAISLSVDNSGLTLYHVGDYGADNQIILEGFAKTNFGPLTLMADAGKSLRATTRDASWGMLSLGYKGATLESLAYQEEDTKNVFSRVAYGDDEKFFGLGYQNKSDSKTLVPYISLEGNGMATQGFAWINSDGITFSTKTALKEPNQGGYSYAVNNMLSRQFSIPPYFPESAPPMTRAGKIVFTLDGKIDGEHASGTAMLGTTVNGIGIAGGISKDDNNYVGRININGQKRIGSLNVDLEVEADHNLSHPRAYLRVNTGGE